MRFLYFVGTAGSGKSTLVKAYKEWLDSAGISSLTINLDPGVDALPYEADIDIREWISLGDVMTEYDLGPNGAQVAAADLMAVNVDKIKDILDGEKASFVLVDTPGQLELFAFRRSADVFVEAFGRDKSMVIYLMDPMLCRNANGFVSNMMLASLVQFRLNLPIAKMLTKADVLKEEEKQQMIDWFEAPDALYGALLDSDSDMQTLVGMELYKALESIGSFGMMRAVSAVDGQGLEEIYAVSELEFFGGEDPVEQGD